MRYLDTQMQNPGSIVGDDMGNLLICDNASFTAHLIKPSVTLREIMRFSQDVDLHSSSMCYNSKTDALIVAVTFDLHWTRKLFWKESDSSFLYLIRRDDRKF